METVEELYNFLADYDVSSVFIDGEEPSDLFLLALFPDYITVINKSTHNIYNLSLDYIFRLYKENNIFFFVEDVIDV